MSVAVSDKRTAGTSGYWIWPLMAFLHAVAGFWGATVVMGGDQRPIALLYAIMFAMTVTLACRNDARNRQRPLLPMTQFIMLLTWTIAAPVYLVWSRGMRGVLVAIAWAITLVAAYWIGAIVTALVVGV